MQNVTRMEMMRTKMIEMMVMHVFIGISCGKSDFCTIVSSLKGRT